MFEEKRRVNRTGDELEIAITLRSEEDKETVLAGPVKGILTNISSCGAGLVLNQVNVQQYHLFYTLQDDPTYLLYLEIILESGKTFSIPVIPIWYDCDHHNKDMPFKLGVDFIPGPDNVAVKNLNQLMRERRKGRGGWLSDFI